MHCRHMAGQRQSARTPSCAVLQPKKDTLGRDAPTRQSLDLFPYRPPMPSPACALSAWHVAASRFWRGAAPKVIAALAAAWCQATACAVSDLWFLHAQGCAC